MKAAVIINTVNENPFNLKRAISSYKSQRNVDLQIILSTINNDISLDYYYLDKSITIAISPTKGIYQQLNNALSYIEDDVEWITYASGNDYANSMKLFNEISACIKHNKKVCYSDFIKVSEGSPSGVRTSFHDYDYKKHLEGNFVNDCATFHKSLLKYAPFKLEWGNYAYYDFWLRIYESEGNVFYYLRQPTWTYIITNDSRHVKASKDAEWKRKRLLLKNKMLKSHGKK